MAAMIGGKSRLLLGLGTVVLCLGMLLSGADAGPKAKKKGGGKKNSPLKETMSKLLEAQGQEVMKCAVNQSLDKGGKKVEVMTKVTINNRGQVIDINTIAKCDKTEHVAPVRECVDKLIKAIKFPPSESPLTTLQREWIMSDG